MSEPTLEGVIVPKGQSPAIPTGRQKFYETYNTRSLGNEPIGGDSGGGGGGGSKTSNFMSKIPGKSGNVAVRVPFGAPKFLGARSVLLFAWMAAMAMVSLDEWHTNHVLPRPARLWYTSLTFFLLAAVSTIDVLVPLTNLFALGLIIVLAMQYYTGTGQFGVSGVAEAAAGALTNPATPVSTLTPGTGNESVSLPTTGQPGVIETQYIAGQNSTTINLTPGQIAGTSQ